LIRVKLIVGAVVEEGVSPQMGGVTYLLPYVVGESR
jgi:hypothetical protein